ncbi:hypothetical protein RSK20926_22074 [Roseobacter sp. SK209-2-6]|uniref:helix-turn-helix domain-containing protein n=1 Tax=Roseobacter sp. SK209-2-6 TaxID=388739 RepID=UPI0000F3F3CE|nr:helix-turn-helix transcriptional regulator [Roseobacter sp. SK209-2-6]EBA16458.1 hypothetical protein RSK20926_22074 [Roseobacter sp. SK209-2-6]
MNDDARTRLKQALAESKWSADALSKHLGWPATYISRVTTGRINAPSDERLDAICAVLMVDRAYLIEGSTGTHQSNSTKPLPKEVTQDQINQIADFVRQHGLTDQRKQEK